MNIGSKPNAPRNDETLIEEAVAEFLLAEDRQQPLDIPGWLERHASVRDRLEVFLDDHRRASEALGNRMDRLSLPTPDELNDTQAFDSSSIAAGPRFASTLDALGTIGNYRLGRLLGSGGMGRVYEAQDEHGHRFAIKLIAGHMAATSEAIERFQQEGMVASTVNHPRCVFVHAADTADGQPYITMELMPGTTLRDLVQSRGPLDVPDAIAKIIDVIDGLNCAHACNLIHRDVKPSNCYLDREGRVKVGDFGLAKSLESDAGLTLSGSIVGTPLFASPEQLRGDPLDARTDVYSTCATLYYLLIGKAPFEHANATTVIARVLSEDAGSVRAIRSDVPIELERVIIAGMSRNRDQRPRDMRELRDQLSQFLPGTKRIAGLGLRFAAFCIDIAIISIVVFIVATLRPDWFANLQAEIPSIRFETHFLTSIIQALYFLGTEFAFQSTLGKRLFGLRVRSFSANRSLSLAQCCVRIAVWWMLSGIVTDSLLQLSGRPILATFNDPWQWLGYAIGYGVNCLPLLWRPDLRLLHDWASGTQVEFVKQSLERSTVLDFAESEEVELASPLSIGRFTVTRRLAQFADCTWYEGKDLNLGRKVWIAVRPRGSAELPEERRRLTRSPRLRWICSGLQGSERWDSFLGVDSIALSQLAHVPKGMKWPSIRQALSDIANEIQALRGNEFAFAAMLDSESLRVGRNGNILWIDRFPAEDSKEPPVSDREQLDFLYHIAKSMLQSNTRSMPFHAIQLIDRLSPSHPRPIRDVTQLISELHAVEERPSESTLRMRTLQFATQCGLGLAPFGAMLALLSAGHLLRLDRVEDELLRLYALKYIAHSDLAASSLSTIAQHSTSEGLHALDIDSDWSHPLENEIAALEDLRSQAVAACSTLDRATLNSANEIFINSELIPWLIAKNELPENGNFIWDLPSELPKAHAPMQSGTPESKFLVTDPIRATFAQSGIIRPEQFALTIDRMHRTPGQIPSRTGWRVALLAFFPWIAMSLWGMVTRGGVSRRLAGLVIVNRNGRVASWIQLLARSALLWAPLGALIASTILLEFYGWATPSIAFALKATCVVGPFVYVAIGLLSSGRGLHDRLAGTRVAPR